MHRVEPVGGRHARRVSSHPHLGPGSGCVRPPGSGARILRRRGAGGRGFSDADQRPAQPSRAAFEVEPGRSLAIQCWGEGEPAVIYDAGTGTSGIEHARARRQSTGGVDARLHVRPGGDRRERSGARSPAHGGRPGRRPPHPARGGRSRPALRARGVVRRRGRRVPLRRPTPRRGGRDRHGRCAVTEGGHARLRGARVGRR